MVAIMGTDTRTVIRQRVRTGIAVLDADQAFHDWYTPTKVDLTFLDIANPCLCVLGQLFGVQDGRFGYDLGLDHFGYELASGKWVPRSVGWAIDHGFTTDLFIVREAAGHTEDDQVAELNAIWSEEIAELRLVRSRENIAAIVQPEEAV